MAFTRKLREADYNFPAVVLAFGVRSPSKPRSGSTFSYYLAVEKVRTTRMAVQCSGDKTGSIVKVQLPLAFHSSIHLFASFFKDAPRLQQRDRTRIWTLWACDPRKGSILFLTCNLLVKTCNQVIKMFVFEHTLALDEICAWQRLTGWALGVGHELWFVSRKDIKDSDIEGCLTKERLHDDKTCVQISSVFWLMFCHYLFAIYIYI